MTIDTVFKKPRGEIKAFQFDEEVANVFDDMVSRSVPFYHEIHGILLDMADRCLAEHTAIYDLGCSTGTTMVLLDQHLKKRNFKRGRIYGIDNSAAMIRASEKKFTEHGLTNRELLTEDLEEFIFPEPAGLVLMNYTLQFLSPKSRDGLIKKIFDSLNSGGIFLLAEKICSADEEIQDLTTTLYYDFKKRMGYSELEISQKREALENVLIPLTPEAQIQQLKDGGFKHVEMLFRWYNFAVYIGKKA